MEGLAPIEVELQWQRQFKQSDMPVKPTRTVRRMPQRGHLVCCGMNPIMTYDNLIEFLGPR